MAEIVERLGITSETDDLKNSIDIPTYKATFDTKVSDNYIPVSFSF